MASLPGAHGVAVKQFRLLQTADAKMAAAWMVAELPIPLKLEAALSEVLKSLISSDVLRGEVIEYLYGRGHKPSPVAFGLTGFLRNSFAARYLAAPYPHLEIALLEQARTGDGKGEFLDHDEVAHANAGEGLTAFPLLWFQRTNDPSLPETRSLLQAGQQSFLRIHRGYRLHGILKEAPADMVQAFLDGGFREYGRIAAGTPLGFSQRKLAREHVILGASRADAERTMPGTMISHLFVYQTPRCGFTQFERQVLERAIDYRTDEEIAAELGATLAAVSLRWRSIYARVAEHAPSALETSQASGNTARGREKRRRVIAFVNVHPEEIRPYAQP